jgi:TetR/AcrR family transcriptional regulator
MAKPPPDEVAQTPLDPDTEGRILDAAHAVFMRRGTAGARMTEIAREARVNHALVHYYFRSKQRLAEAVFRRAIGQFFPVMIGILVSDAPVEDKVRLVAAAQIDMLQRNRYLPGYLIAELNHYPERAAQLLETMSGTTPANLRARLFGTLGRQLEDAARDGRIRPTRPQEFVLNLVSMVVYAFAARPLVMAILGLDDASFTEMMEQRKTEIPAFFLAALRP